MKIIRAEHLGMCFGVRDAIELALQHSRSQRLTVLGELVHNETVLSQLRARGVSITDDLAKVSTSQVMITAHGTSERRLQSVRASGLNVIEATCPLVRVAHEAITSLAADGFHPVIIGKHDHVEVRGLTGDLDEFDVVLSEEDVQQLRERPRIGIAAQTTQPVERVKKLVALIRERFPEAEVRYVDTVCRPTKQRQESAVSLAKSCELVIVIGGANSNNTRELTLTCALHCPQVRQISCAAELKPEWLDRVAVAGITAGTSTPDEIIDSVEERLRHFASRQSGSDELRRAAA